MTRSKPDRLLGALIAKLPAEIAPWPRADRVAWLQMMAMAFDVVYGPCSAIRIVPEAAQAGGGNQCANARHDAAAGSPHSCPPPLAREGRERAVPSPPQRFYVDRDGFAMADGKPIAMEDLTAGAILWDERVGIECGDVAAILWRDVGTSRRSLPPDVTLRPLFDES